MSFLKSIMLGSEGSYNVFGTQVNFQNELPSHSTPPSLEGAGIISQLAMKCINSHAFRWITQGYAHVFIHEMGHALACKILTGQNAKVTICTSRLVGETEYPSAICSAWKNSVTSVAGPMGDVAFSTCKLVAATALKRYLFWPVALALGSGAVIWMAGELLYAYVSAAKEDDGDFGSIARHSDTHLALASIALISQCALGIFAAISIL